MKPQDHDGNIDMSAEGHSSDDAMGSDERPVPSPDEMDSDERPVPSPDEMDSDELPIGDSNCSMLGSDELPVVQTQEQSDSESPDELESDERPAPDTNSDSEDVNSPQEDGGGYDDDDFEGPEVRGVGPEGLRIGSDLKQSPEKLRKDDSDYAPPSPDRPPPRVLSPVVEEVDVEALRVQHLPVQNGFRNLREWIVCLLKAMSVLITG